MANATAMESLPGPSSADALATNTIGPASLLAKDKLFSVAQMGRRSRENSSTFIGLRGRDGQEIEPSAGRSLAQLLDSRQPVESRPDPLLLLHPTPGLRDNRVGPYSMHSSQLPPEKSSFSAVDSANDAAKQAVKPFGNRLAMLAKYLRRGEARNASNSSSPPTFDEDDPTGSSSMKHTAIVLPADQTIISTNTSGQYDSFKAGLRNLVSREDDGHLLRSVLVKNEQMNTDAAADRFRSAQSFHVGSNEKFIPPPPPLPMNDVINAAMKRENLLDSESGLVEGALRAASSTGTAIVEDLGPSASSVKWKFDWVLDKIQSDPVLMLYPADLTEIDSYETYKEALQRSADKWDSVSRRLSKYPNSLSMPELPTCLAQLPRGVSQVNKNLENYGEILLELLARSISQKEFDTFINQLSVYAEK